MLRALFCFAALWSLAVPVAAQVPDEVAGLTVLPGWRTERGTHIAALQIDLAPGWKTYWRSPGEAGIPPRFSWSGSRNLGAADVSWPVPGVFVQNGLRSVGYGDRIILPIEFAPQRPGETISLRGQIDIGVCKDVCIPTTLDISASLPPRAAVIDPRIRAALANRPMSAAEAGVASRTCVIEPISDGVRLTARFTMPSLGRAEMAIVEFADKSVWVATAETSRDGPVLTTVTDLVPTQGSSLMVQRSDLRFTILAGEAAVDIVGCAAG